MTFFCFLVGTILIVLQDNILFFYTPSEISQKDLKQDEKMRLGGLVEEGSVQRAKGSPIITFNVTDLITTVPITFKGILPDLFREGQGTVVEGFLDKNNNIVASKVYAKHDENYMPASIKQELEKNKQWRKDY